MWDFYLYACSPYFSPWDQAELIHRARSEERRAPRSELKQREPVRLSRFRVLGHAISQGLEVARVFIVGAIDRLRRRGDAAAD